MMATTSFMVRLSFPGIPNVGRALGDAGPSLAFFCADGTKTCRARRKPWLRFVRARQLPCTGTGTVRQYPGLSPAVLQGCEAGSCQDGMQRGGNSSPPFAERAFLGHRGDQRAVLLEDHAAGQAAPALGARRILGVEQPLV